jgi:hypothetical protein
MNSSTSLSQPTVTFSSKKIEYYKTTVPRENGTELNSKFCDYTCEEMTEGDSISRG